GDTGRHHAGVAMAAKDHFAEVLGLEQFDHVTYMCIEIDAGGWSLRGLLEPAQGHGMGLVAFALEPRHEVGERPAPAPAARNQNESSHQSPPWRPCSKLCCAHQRW